MHRFLITSILAVGSCCLAHAATAPSPRLSTQPITVSADSSLANLQKEVLALQTNVQELKGAEARNSDGAYQISLEPAPNADGGLIPSGG